MDLTLLTVGGILFVFLIIAFVLSRQSTFASIFSSIFSLGFAAFCGFGFLACFEPSNSPVWPWQLAYAVIGIGFLIAAFRGLKNAWNRIRQTGCAN